MALVCKSDPYPLQGPCLNTSLFKPRSIITQRCGKWQKRINGIFHNNNNDNYLRRKQNERLMCSNVCQSMVTCLCLHPSTRSVSIRYAKPPLKDVLKFLHSGILTPNSILYVRPQRTCCSAYEEKISNKFWLNSMWEVYKCTIPNFGHYYTCYTLMTGDSVCLRHTQCVVT
jgi:hypothetical protein